MPHTSLAKRSPRVHNVLQGLPRLVRHRRDRGFHAILRLRRRNRRVDDHRLQRVVRPDVRRVLGFEFLEKNCFLRSVLDG